MFNVHHTPNTLEWVGNVWEEGQDTTQLKNTRTETTTHTPEWLPHASTTTTHAHTIAGMVNHRQEGRHPDRFTQPTTTNGSPPVHHHLSLQNPPASHTHTHTPATNRWGKMGCVWWGKAKAWPGGRKCVRVGEKGVGGSQAAR